MVDADVVLERNSLRDAPSREDAAGHASRRQVHAYHSERRVRTIAEGRNKGKKSGIALGHWAESARVGLE